MRYTETFQLFEQAFEFPATQETVVDRLGDVELTTPAGDAVTVGETLRRTERTTYRSPDELYTSLLGNLEDGFIGRKFYDDRSGSPSSVTNVRGTDVSF